MTQDLLGTGGEIWRRDIHWRGVLIPTRLDILIRTALSGTDLAAISIERDGAYPSHLVNVQSNP